MTEGETETEIEDTSKKKGKPRVISNVQIYPPGHSGYKENARLNETKVEDSQGKREEQDWEIVNRKRRNKTQGDRQK